MDREGNMVERIARAFRSGAPKKHARDGAALHLGIGDDAAIISPGGKNDWVLSCDAFLEGVHFLAKTHSPDSVGYKSLVRATSDLAAMGATPRYFLLTLAIPANRTGAWLDEFLNGMARAAHYLKTVLAGGDTTKGTVVSTSITVVGEIGSGHAVTRSGARPGDIIYVSGTLGRAQLGLELLLHRKTNASGLRSGRARHSDRALQGLLQSHLYPEIQLALGTWLAKRRMATAMMDISDGLSTDLARLCSASGVGARTLAELVPRVAIPAELSKLAAGLKLDPLQMALHGGEDYELLFTVSPRNVKNLRAAPGFSQLKAIGEVTRGKSIVLIGPHGTQDTLEPQGWDPFRHQQ
jgi:thiamine-monophosphate kinase